MIQKSRHPNMCAFCLNHCCKGQTQHQKYGWLRDMRTYFIDCVYDYELSDRDDIKNAPTKDVRFLILLLSETDVPLFVYYK